jgi:hypothetical protein
VQLQAGDGMTGEPLVTAEQARAALTPKHLAQMRVDYGASLGDGSDNPHEDSAVVALVDCYVALHARLEAAQRACRTLGKIIDRQAEDICRISGVPMPEDGDADFEKAWSIAFDMAARLSVAEARERAFHDQAEAYRQEIDRLAVEYVALHQKVLAIEYADNWHLRNPRHVALIRAALDGEGNRNCTCDPASEDNRAGCPVHAPHSGEGNQ